MNQLGIWSTSYRCYRVLFRVPGVEPMVSGVFRLGGLGFTLGKIRGITTRDPQESYEWNLGTSL